MPGSIVYQTFDISTILLATQIADLETLSTAIAPSGSSEMTAVSLTVSGTVATLMVSGGQPDADRHGAVLAMISDGEAPEWLGVSGVSQVLPTDMPQVAPVPGFGAARSLFFRPEAAI